MMQEENAITLTCFLQVYIQQTEEGERKAVEDEAHVCTFTMQLYQRHIFRKVVFRRGRCLIEDFLLALWEM